MAKRKKVDGTDRFIPRRSSQDMDIASLQVQSKGLHDKPKARSTTFHQALAQTMFGVSDMSALPVYNLTASNERRTNTTRCRPNALLNHIVAPVSAIRIMDAPNVENDFYLNLMDWGSNDVLAIALGKSIYLWNRQTKSHSKLFTLRSQTITSLKWGANTHINNLAVGTSNGNVEFWDTRAKRCCGKFSGHAARVSSLAWKGYILTTGSLDNTIAHYDTRMESSRLSTLRQHKGEVCGLAWSHDGRMLASGGSDHTICVWSNDLARRDPWHSINSHKAAVKAVSWSPWDNGILATGGGAIDKTVKRWRITERTCKLQHSQDTEAQVSGLLWSRPGVHTAKQLLSSHGPNVNSLKLWDVGGMTLLKVYGGHTGRILTMTESPDGSTVATLGADETLHFWPGFDLMKRRKQTREEMSSLDKIAGLR